jgi:hypothetical protein
VLVKQIHPAYLKEGGIKRIENNIKKYTGKKS